MGVIFMSKRRTEDKLIGTQTTTTTVDEHGEVKQTTSTQKVLVAQEPDYIKLYLSTLLTFRKLPKQMNELLLELLKLMTYADPAAKHGGQLIILNMFVKEEICERLGIKDSTFKNNLTKFTQSGILKHIGYSTYQANPNMFGRGDWLDIKSIQATFNFNTGIVEADIQMQDGKDETAN
jgi:hypothetical protein